MQGRSQTRWWGYPFTLAVPERPCRMPSDGDDGQARGREWERNVISVCGPLMTEHLASLSFTIVEEIEEEICSNIEKRNISALESFLEKKKLGQEPAFLGRILYLGCRISTKHIFRLWTEIEIQLSSS